ncbi:MAG: anti-sigma factor domain-containing protein [Solirubrobacterales bacterium]
MNPAAMSHPDHDDLTGYVLGALESGDERRIASHLEACDRCASELDRLAVVTDVLAESVPQRRAPASLRAQVLDVVDREAAVPRGRARLKRPFTSRLYRSALRPATALVATALVAAAAGGYLIADRDQGDGGTTTHAIESKLRGAEGSIVVEGDAATLHVRGMPTLAKGSVYQVWVADGGATVPSAAFVPHGDGTATAAIPEASRSGADGVMVTRERGVGARAPTFPPVLSAAL